MPPNRRAGVIQIQVNGTIFDAAGDFDYNLGKPMTESLIGPSGGQGYKEMPQVPFIEGTIRDSQDLDLAVLLNIRDATITLTLANDKVIVLREARYAAEGKVNTGEAEIEVKFEGESADEIPA